jgi:Pentapeptide repeats (8 copies)
MERVRHLLPYRIEPDRQQQINWGGQKQLVKNDQRDEWWSKFGIASGDPDMQGMPADIRTDKLDPLTAEPILNGLIAECRKKHQITPNTNRAQIYEWLLRDVLKRVHDKSGKQHLIEAKEEDIARLLEEVAVTAWHNGDVRATTKTKVLERCEKTEQTDLLHCVFPDQQKSNVTSLFLAFYFQEAGERQGQDRAFEFSHKSFGEYLLARRIVRFMRTVCNRITDGAWDSEIGLKHWAELFGPTLMDNDLWTFVKHVMDLESVETVNDWRKTIIKLLDRIRKRGMPMNQLGLSSFQEMDRQNQLAMRSVLFMHSACYRPGQAAIPMMREGRQAQAFELLALNTGGDYLWPRMVRKHFCGLDLCDSNCLFGSMPWFGFQGADLSNSNFSGSNLFCANFEDANLEGARLGKIGFHYSEGEGDIGGICVDLRGANLIRANLTGAILDGAILGGANIQGANLTKAEVSIEQLRVTTGEPALLPDGKPPKAGWRNKRPRKPRNKKADELISDS